jgi:hypothetical protein
MYLACERNSIRPFVGGLKGKEHLEDTEVDGIILIGP